MTWKDYLPNLKQALTGFYEKQLKSTIEAKSTEFKDFLEQNQKTQRVLLAIAYFWTGNFKYLALGVLTSYLTVYVRSLLALSS